jgi:hypothetical protein
MIKNEKSQSCGHHWISIYLGEELEMSTAEDDNGAENSNESHNKVMNDDVDDDDDVNATKSSQAPSPSAEAATSGSIRRSRTPPPVTVLPICCILDHEKRLFRVTRSKGKTLAAGGFGITISEPVETTVTATPVDDDGELDSQQNGENMEDAPTPTPTPATSANTSTSQTPNTSNSYLFFEEVLFLHERGMIECYRYDDDDDEDDKKRDSNIVTSTDNGDPGRQQQHKQRLDSYQLYNMLEQTGGVSLPIYLVYAYLLQQDYRVLRHFDNRREILDAMEQEKTPSKLLVNSDTATDNDNEENIDDEDKAGEDDDRDDDDDHKEDKNGADESKDATMDLVRRKRKRDNKSGLKALRLQLRREAAQAPPPVLCNTNVNASSNNNSDDDDGTGSVSIAFDVYRPNSNFCKGAPGLPDFYVAATHYNTSGTSTSGANLSFPQIQRLLAMSAGRSLKIATVSDAGAVIMFGITDHGVPAIQQGESSDSTTNQLD